MCGLNTLIENNREWAAEQKRQKPDFFKNLSAQQKPKYLWIGCSDSRVPANQIAGLEPGEVFVHRNIANVVVHTDFNCLSVIEYAVTVLKVEHIIVTGHYGCGGIIASMDREEHGLIDNWLRHIGDVYRANKPELESIDDTRLRANRLCELNVIEQVKNVAHTTIVQKAWKNEQKLSIHGCIYSIENGILHDLDMTVSGLKQFKDKKNALMK